MYHTGRNPLAKVTRKSELVNIPKGEKQRRLHKAFLRYHDSANWPLLRETLKLMGREDLIGNGKQHLIPTWQPADTDDYSSPRRKNSSAGGKKGKTTTSRNRRTGDRSGMPVKGNQPKAGQILTQHTGLPPRKSR